MNDRIVVMEISGLERCTWRESSASSAISSPTPTGSTTPPSRASSRTPTPTTRPRAVSSVG